MLPTDIAQAFGYVPFEDEEVDQQYSDLTETYKVGQIKLGDPKTYPKTGDIFKNKQGKFQCYWKPAGGNYTEEDKSALAGWYEVPTNGDIEEWCFDSCCPTPVGDEVEPDHPDSWVRILGLI
jgi:hypothetical protein